MTGSLPATEASWMSVGSAQQNHASVSRGRGSTSPRSAGSAECPAASATARYRVRKVDALSTSAATSASTISASSAWRRSSCGSPACQSYVRRSRSESCRCGVISGRSSSSEPLGTSRRIVYWIGSTFPTISLAITKSRISRMSCGVAQGVNGNHDGWISIPCSRSRATARGVALRREQGIEIPPSWLPFTPWATPQDILEILDFVIANEMVGNVDPIQYTIRLLVPKGSLLLDRPEITPHLQDYDRDRLTYDWQAGDPQLDRLHAELAEIVEADVAAEVDSASTFRTLYRAVADAAGHSADPADLGDVEPRPRLTEAWFCCAEPTRLRRSSYAVFCLKKKTKISAEQRERIDR